jgi:hypothetical protein
MGQQVAGSLEVLPQVPHMAACAMDGNSRSARAWLLCSFTTGLHSPRPWLGSCPAPLAFVDPSEHSPE